MGSPDSSVTEDYRVRASCAKDGRGFRAAQSRNDVLNVSQPWQIGDASGDVQNFAKEEGA
jgi:hypothetical protein